MKTSTLLLLELPCPATVEKSILRTITREAWTTIGARLLVIEAEADLLVEEVEDVEAVPEAIRDLDLHQIDEGMVGAADLHPEGAHGDALEASVDLVADLPHRA